MDLNNPVSILASIEGLSYIIIFCLFLLEGPVLNYVVGFASSLGFFNIFIILILATVANVLGDLVYYFIGRIGKKAIIDKYVKGSLSSNRIKKIREYLKKNPGKTLFVIKVTPIFTGPGLILTGAENMHFKKFIFYSIIFSIVQCLVMVLLGFFSGKLFRILFNYVKYGTYLAGGFVIIVIALWFLVRIMIEKLSAKIEKI